MRIADLLSHGAENGVTLRHLEKLAGLPGRDVRRQIERAREILRTAAAIEQAEV